MSVNRAAARGRSRQVSPVLRAMKTGGFWLVLGLMSFLVGALIVSPVYNAVFPVNTKQSSPQAQGGTQAAVTPPTTPAPAVNAAPIRSRRAVARDAEPDVVISPSHRNRSREATPSEVDDTGARTAPADDTGSGNGIDNPAPDQPVRRHGTTSSNHRRAVQAGAEVDTGSAADDTPAPHRTTSTHRSTRPAATRDTGDDAAATHLRSADTSADTSEPPAKPHRKPTSKPKPSKPVQQGDTIE